MFTLKQQEYDCFIHKLLLFYYSLCAPHEDYQSRNNDINIIDFKGTVL
jgi:hypothetical protein